MSTFIATLGFDSQPVHLQSAKTSILVASIISAAIGLSYLRYNSKAKQSKG
jgi:NhaA family Na+:H+ antiporter